MIGLMTFLNPQSNSAAQPCQVMSEVGSRKSEVGSRKSEVGSRKSEVGIVYSQGKLAHADFRY